jgi:S1-C subfamily serine protease
LRVVWLCCCVGLWSQPAPAQDPEILWRDFDARMLSVEEKRLLQVGLTAGGHYEGLIDGAWGPRSQAAIEAYVRANDLEDEDGLVHGYHMAALAGQAMAFVAEHGLAYRGGGRAGHLLLAPAGAFVDDPSTGIPDLVLPTGGIEIRTLSSQAELAVAVHRALEAEIAAWQEPYLVRRESRWVTARGAGGPLVYVRTDYSPVADSFFTTIVSEEPGAEPALYKVVVGSIADGRAASLASPGGLLERTVAALQLAMAAPAEPPVAPSAIPPSETEAVPAPSAGTGFYVNNNDLVTAGHVVDGCAAVEFTDGTPLALVARHPRLDLALLSAPVRSRAWIAIGEAAEAKLGQRVAALGYPYFGQFGTALNMTAGNVSALVGIADDPDSLTISAPVQPGNSGGPLLASDGTLLGVVVARLDGLKVVEQTGSLPENINYAVAGPALLAFLVEEGVSLPRHEDADLDVEDGIPEAMQQAVVPVICRP